MAPSWVSGRAFRISADQLFELVFAAISLGFIKLPNRRRSRVLQLLQRRPALKKSASASRVQITKPLQGLRKVHFQRGRQLIGQGRAFVDQLTPTLCQQLNATRESIIGNPYAQMLAMRIKISNNRSASRGSSLAPLG